MNTPAMAIYKDRFENLMRVASKITASLNIGDILEMIRDNVKEIIPHAKEACLILVDPDAPSYTRPLHCTVKKDSVRTNCPGGWGWTSPTPPEPWPSWNSMG